MEHSGSIPLPPPGLLAKIDAPGPRVAGFGGILTLLIYLSISVHGLTDKGDSDRERIVALEVAEAVSKEREIARVAADGVKDEAHKRVMARYDDDKRKAEELWREDLKQSRELHKSTLDVLGRALSALPPARR